MDHRMYAKYNSFEFRVFMFDPSWDADRCTPVRSKANMSGIRVRHIEKVALAATKKSS
jgi:hypothetical protein